MRESSTLMSANVVEQVMRRTEEFNEKNAYIGTFIIKNKKCKGYAFPDGSIHFMQKWGGKQLLKIVGIAEGRMHLLSVGDRQSRMMVEMWIDLYEKTMEDYHVTYRWIDNIVELAAYVDKKVDEYVDEIKNVFGESWLQYYTPCLSSTLN